MIFPSFLKKAAGPAIALLLIAAAFACRPSPAEAASLTIKGGRESGMQGIQTYLREDEERIRARRAAQDAAWSAAGPHLGVDCADLWFPADAYCRSGNCSGFSGAARELCERGPVAMYASKYNGRLEYIATFVDNGNADVDRFGENKYAALKAMNMSRQARLEFAVYHLSGMSIHIWGDEPIRIFNK